MTDEMVHHAGSCNEEKRETANDEKFSFSLSQFLELIHYTGVRIAGSSGSWKIDIFHHSQD